MVQLNTVMEGLPHILLNKHKSYRFWLSVQEVIFFGMKSWLKWIYKPVRAGSNTMVVSVINTISNECKGYMEQERIPFQITYILSYYLKEAASCLSPTKPLLWVPALNTLEHCNYAPLVCLTLSTFLVHVWHEEQDLLNVVYMMIWFSILKITEKLTFQFF